MKKIVKSILVILVLLSIGCIKKDPSASIQETTISFLNACHEGNFEGISKYATQEVIDYYHSLPTYFFGEDYNNFPDELKENVQSFISKSISAGYQSYEIKEIKTIDSKQALVKVSVEGVSSNHLYKQEEFLSYLSTLPQDELESKNEEELTPYFVQQNIDFILTRLDEAIQNKDFTTTEESYKVILDHDIWKISR
ncbi:MAG: hypothetical protein IKE51_05980 [Solobacterium sp.]|nr:hypothetical protein [Solobacterium sp.]